MNKDNLLSLVPGYCQGLTKVFTTYPFDVIKTKMQLSNKRLTTMNTIRHLIRTDPTVFVRGMSVPMVSFPIDRAISYKIYEDLNNLKFNPYQSAFVGGIFSSFFNVPMQYITTNAINTDKKQYKGIKKLITVTMNNKKDLYRGYSFDTIRSISGSPFFWEHMETLKKHCPKTISQQLFRA